jgi:predicted NAD/FAD-binding protein
MSSAVWSTPPEKMRRFPAVTLLRFFHNHGFLGLNTQHPWWTIEGGSQTYVAKLIAPFKERIRLRTPVRRIRRSTTGIIEVVTDGAAERFDKVIFACHAPAALEILGSDASVDERRLLGRFQYQPNTVVLHTDDAVMPRTRLAWSSWNYRIAANPRMHAEKNEGGFVEQVRVSTHYWMNRLQGVSHRQNYFVSLDEATAIHSQRVLRTFSEEHPLFDLAAIQAQPEMPTLNAIARGKTETYFVGAWQRYGFHEDGLLSAANLATLLLKRDPWEGRG